MCLIQLLENSEPLVLYHITDNARFRLKPDYEPVDNSLSINDRSGNKGIYLARDVEKWVNGHGYIRPFVVEMLVDPSALDHDTIGRWGGEVFIPASQFDKIKVKRVIPIDAHAREKYGEYGWIEGSSGYEFDTGNKIDGHARGTPFKGWRYPDDVRTLSPETVKTLKQRFKVGYKARVGR